MRIGPTPNNWIELLDQQAGRAALFASTNALTVGQKCFHVLVGLALSAACHRTCEYFLTEEIEPIRYMREQRFHRKAQPPLGHEGFDEWLRLVSQQLFRDAGDDEIICVSHIVDLGLVAGFGITLPELRFELLFQSIKGQVGQYGRDDPSLRSSRPCRIQSTGFQISRFQPFPRTTLSIGTLVISQS